MVLNDAVDYDLAIICYGQNDDIDSFSRNDETIIQAIRSKYLVIIPEYIKPLNQFLGATIPENESQSKSMILFQ